MTTTSHTDARFLRALARKSVDRTPVWLMRQAGRYLPEYRATRTQAGDFLTLCKTPELAAEVTVQPLRRFLLDASIIFSDILIVPDAMGLGLRFVQGEGPVFNTRICTAHDIAQLPAIDAARDCHFTCDAIRAVKASSECTVPVIGFAGSPWTLAVYMINGGKSGDGFAKSKVFAYEHPHAAQALLGKLIQAITDLLIAQAEAGADVLMLFDTWGSILTHEGFMRFSYTPIAAVIEGLRANHSTKDIPIIVYGKGESYRIFAKSGVNAVGIDWTVDIGNVLTEIGENVAVQGNFDPNLLIASDTVVATEVTRILDRVNSRPGHIFNLGHGIRQDTPPERVSTLIRTVHNYSNTTL